MSERPRYRLLAESFIHNSLLAAGTEIEYSGPPGSLLEPLNDAAREAKAAAAKAGATLITGDVVNAYEGDVEKLVKERTPRKAKDKPPVADNGGGGETQSGNADEFA